ncbi:hypothetical protein CRG98_038711 [Punica granatum]|uniref:Uncharacterized protein n=1 Tax=Punica granatum TaxID=22663 RepID=A0A2I0IAW6_PUNGR|nr:hypothetical protein CRG98_038711 [Punica granatum]
MDSKLRWMGARRSGGTCSPSFRHHLLRQTLLPMSCHCRRRSSSASADDDAPTPTYFTDRDKKKIELRRFAQTPILVSSSCLPKKARKRKKTPIKIRLFDSGLRLEGEEKSCGDFGLCCSKEKRNLAMLELKGEEESCEFAMLELEAEVGHDER